ncbi:MAG: DUF1641 domain-containing protein [Deltaproteobacteria bacterium]|jgi:uncharacterized protein YjgD (DUF1641 family)
MTNEELILERLDRLEAQLAPISQTAAGLKELRDDLLPLSGQAFRLLTRELEDVEAGFQMEDLLALCKRTLHSVKYLTFALEQLENIVDFVTTIEPLLKSAVPQVIHYLDDLDQRGILRIMQAMLDVRAKIAAAYTPEDIDQIGDGVVAMLGSVKKLGDPQARSFLDKMAELPSRVNLQEAKPVGPFGLLNALTKQEIRQGLGVLMELTKVMGQLKNGDQMEKSTST